MTRILLSAAEVGPHDRDSVADAVTSGWLSPIDPARNGFELQLAGAA